MRERDGRAQRTQINRIFGVVLSVFVGGVLNGCSLIPAVAVFSGDVVNRENAVLGACLNSHVGNAEPVVDIEVLEPLAREFHRLVKSAVNAYLADDMQNNVLTADIALRLAYDIELDCGRNLEPSLAAYHACRHIG